MIFGVLRRISHFVFYRNRPPWAYFSLISLPFDSFLPVNVWYLFFSTVSRSFTHFRLLPPTDFARYFVAPPTLSSRLIFWLGIFRFSSYPAFFRSFRCSYSLSHLPHPFCRSSLSARKIVIFHSCTFCISDFAVFSRRGSILSHLFHLFRLSFSFLSSTAVLL